MASHSVPVSDQVILERDHSFFFLSGLPLRSLLRGSLVNVTFLLMLNLNLY